MMYCYGEERFETQRRKCRDLQPCPLSLCCDRRTRSAQCYSCCTQKKNRRWFSNHRLRIFSRHPSDSQSLSCRLLFSQKDAEDEWPHPWQCLTRIRAYPHLSPGDHLQSNSWHHILKQRLIKNPYSVWFFWTTEVNGSPWRKPLCTEKLIFLLLDFSTNPSFGHAAQV